MLATLLFVDPPPSPIHTHAHTHRPPHHPLHLQSPNKGIDSLILSQVQDRSAAAQDFAEGSGEVDPLDAYMAENDAAIEAAGEEVDPLDAFMADLAPTVRRDMTATPAPGTPAPLATAGTQKSEAEDAADVKGGFQVRRVHGWHYSSLLRSAFLSRLTKQTSWNTTALAIHLLGLTSWLKSSWLALTANVLIAGIVSSLV